MTERIIGKVVRDRQSWRIIFEDLGPHDASKKILESLTHYPDSECPRPFFIDDVEQLVRVLDAWAAVKVGRP